MRELSALCCLALEPGPKGQGIQSLADSPCPGAGCLAVARVLDNTQSKQAGQRARRTQELLEIYTFAPFFFPSWKLC